MCGRYTLTTDAKVIAANFNVSQASYCDGLLGDLSIPVLPVSEMPSGTLSANYNVAPTHLVPVILEHNQSRVLSAFSWGLVPEWAKDVSIGARAINARVETVTEKPMFRSAVVHRRCLVPADGWFEWEVLPNGKKQPYYFSAHNQSLLAFAGIYESWRKPDGSLHWSVSVLTMDAWPQIEAIHHRMPLIVNSALHERWLGAGNAPLDDVVQASQTANSITVWPVSTAVGNVRNNVPELLREIVPIHDEVTNKPTTSQEPLF